MPDHASQHMAVSILRVDPRPLDDLAVRAERTYIDQAFRFADRAETVTTLRRIRNYRKLRRSGNAKWIVQWIDSQL